MIGIDVSYWQGEIDWRAVAESRQVDFAIIRAGYGKSRSGIDKAFVVNYDNATAVGLDVGVYWYSYAGSKADAAAEAKRCLAVLDGRELNFPVFFDVEERAQLQRGAQFVGGIIEEFCRTIEKGGYWCGFYTSSYYAKTCVPEAVRKRFAFWCAQWGHNCAYEKQCGIWQYTNAGRIPGIDTPVDLDRAFVDYPKLIKSERSARIRRAAT